MYKSIMNKENASKLWKIIQEAGDYLDGGEGGIRTLGTSL